MAPRAVFTNSAPGRMRARRSAERKPRVSSFSSRCRLTTWLSDSSVSMSVKVTPGCDFGVRFQASTFMPAPRHSRAISAPMPPIPMMPTVLPVSCMPSVRGQPPPTMLWCIAPMPRAAAHISAKAISATAVSP
jgi:hypothetical protein